MTQRYTCELTLEVLGPFLTAATATHAHGLDKIFHRNYLGKLVIPAPHLKGKLRMALEELRPFFPPTATLDLDGLFGRSTGQSWPATAPSAAGPTAGTITAYEPAMAAVHFSDLACDAEPLDGHRTRVTIDRATQTAAKNLLRTVEDAFGVGVTATFRGTATFSAASAGEAQQVAAALQAGLRWLPNLGSEKGVGFGRLKAAHVAAPRPLARPTPAPTLAGNGPLLLRIRPCEPILIGDVKKGRTNFIRSRLELPGSVVKGALAAALNEAFGVRPFHRELTPVDAARYPGFEALVRHFAEVRVTHGLPAVYGRPRPIRAPITTVEVHDRRYDEGRDCRYDVSIAEHYDVALAGPGPVLVNGIAPAYSVDAKHPVTYFGAAQPEEIFVTRAAIDDATQRASDGQLFTYSFLCPTGKDGPVEWICEAAFDAIADPAERALVRQQFADALHGHLHRLGKLARQVDLVVEATPPAAVSLLYGGLAIVTLQSDALMLNPTDVAALTPGTDLHALYAAYWDELSGGALRLDDFWAHQGCEGGYLYHRYLGAAERAVHPNRYRPYYLTRAGSVFVLSPADQAAAQRVLAGWLAGGLPWPRWAAAEYSQYGRKPWQNCPFVPENGYGEIAVNLPWHWVRRAPAAPAAAPAATGAQQTPEVNDDQAA